MCFFFVFQKSLNKTYTLTSSFQEAPVSDSVDSHKSESSLESISETASTPDTVSISGGVKHVLREDSSDAEITFKTPPNSIKSSKLRQKSVKDDTPKTGKEQKPKTKKKLNIGQCQSVAKLKKLKLKMPKSKMSISKVKEVRSEMKKIKTKSSKKLKK